MKIYVWSDVCPRKTSQCQLRSFLLDLWYDGSSWNLLRLLIRVRERFGSLVFDVRKELSRLTNEIVLLVKLKYDLRQL